MTSFIFIQQFIHIFLNTISTSAFSGPSDADSKDNGCLVEDRGPFEEIVMCLQPCRG